MLEPEFEREKKEEKASNKFNDFLYDYSDCANRK